MFVVMRSFNRSSADFALHKDQVRIIETSVTHSEDPSSGRRIVIIGRIRNGSPVKWDNPYFEVQCYDRGGKLVDTHATYDSGLILTPGTEHAFRIWFQPSREPSVYADYKVFIVDPIV
jgi:hypothetical protein